MSTLHTLFRKELKAFFQSPVGWIILAFVAGM